MKTLGDRIKYLREKKNIKQKELATKCGLTIVQLSRYETNDRKPDPETLRRLIDVLETNGDYLLGLTNDPSPLEKRESNLSFYGGPNDWTEEEFKAADDFIKEIREARQRALDKANKEQQ
ncbi:helix-turn-helix transcriptional regulator [Paenibacillus sp. FSL E2-8871]|jgi:transcriptional regulator with XRE-family HTH domain|uniref:helix-turn-helix domain-containing protein n=1 Tax=Paenibacillus sp. FSL E2-8871 TaxID=2975326 RepID=UPI0023D8DDED